MFSNGKFKNEVAMVDGKDDCPLQSGTSLHKTYVLHPAKGVTRNWIALEDSHVKSSSSLASTVDCNSPDDRNVFAIYVSYYVKVKLIIGALNSKLSMKLPFTLLPSKPDLTDYFDQMPTDQGSPSQSVNPNSGQIQTETIGVENSLSDYEALTFGEYQGHPRCPRLHPTDLVLGQDRSEL